MSAILFAGHTILFISLQWKQGKSLKAKIIVMIIGKYVRYKNVSNDVNREIFISVRPITQHGADSGRSAQQIKLV